MPVARSEAHPWVGGARPRARLGSRTAPSPGTNQLRPHDGGQHRRRHRDDGEEVTTHRSEHRLELAARHRRQPDRPRQPRRFRQQEGSIALGTRGDNSNSGTGPFLGGVMTPGY
ncbi:arabinofuranosidase catalytic domain-containing protein [Streptomyces sp. WZ-12]|uniref:arabinofuranosidase catalytic domain-containing protein n=1 Tax=Streptomyces sp. WZ-12 TaxID=3030210 RepID=UPI003158802E